MRGDLALDLTDTDECLVPTRAATVPTLPRQTSATLRSKPARATPPAAERAEIVVDRLYARAAKRRQAIAGRILKHAALRIVQDLMG
ncbi:MULTISPECIES: hypothetical protein [Mesorhizobium]|uniref:hypothetical protein n=1 Tax=Mesorhizobium TaxID=68287 RepID=UPI00059B2852|nr:MULTISPECIES: hypothetical protein [Mesorhizobium]OBP89864.1 hypothetical protein BAE40_13115 [Mesorhizobium loti]